jgi:hypothetical protein
MTNRPKAVLRYLQAACAPAASLAALHRLLAVMGFVWLCGWPWLATPGAANAQADPTPAPTARPEIRLSETTLTDAVCGTRCVSRAVDVSMAPAERRTIEQMDVMLLFDNSGSMDDIIDAAQASAADVAQGLRDLLPDTRFAVGVFSDYDDVPWELISDFTFDLPVLQSALDRIPLRVGGDTPESHTRALWESTQLAWRDSAFKVILLFSDAPARSTDIGRDATRGTADDLTYAQALQDVRRANIAVVAVNSGGSSAAAASLQEAADVTNGRYFLLADVTRFAQNIILLVDEVLAGFRLSFTPLLDAQADWVSQSPRSFSYDIAGGTRRVNFTFCPAEFDLPSDDYSIPLDLSAPDGSYANLTLEVRYEELCVNLLVPDTAADTGESCSDVAGVPFWESPAIIVRPAPDNGDDFVYPQVGQPSYVYVDVRNEGIEAASAATMRLFSSPLTLVADENGQWTQVAQQTFTLGPQAQTRLGPFEWTPDVPWVSLRATVSNSEDPITAPNDYACDSNIAQVNRVPLAATNYSLEVGYVGASLQVLLRSPAAMGHDSLDLRMDAAGMPDDGYFVYWGDEAFMQDWLGRSGNVQGGAQRGALDAASDQGADTLTLNDFLGGSGSETYGKLVVVSRDSAELPSVNVGLQARDRIVAGTRLDFIDTAALPTDLPQPDPGPGGLLALLVVGGFIGGLIVLLFVVYLLSSGRNG